MIQRLGRALGPGMLKKEQRGRGQAQWVFCYTDADGSRRRVALSSDKRVAEMKSREILRERDMTMLGLGTMAGQSRPLREIVEVYLVDLATRAVPTHVKNTRARLEHAMAHIKAKRVCDLQPIAVLAYRAERVKDGCSTRTANLHTDTLRSCLTWAEEISLIAANPLAKLPRLPENESTKRYRRRALSEEEIERFLDAAYEDDRRNAEYRFASATLVEGSAALVRRAPRARVPQEPFWRFLLESGARYGEAVKATWADVDLDKRLILLRAENTKAHKQRTIPLLAGLVGELRGLRTHHVAVLSRPLRPDDRVFLTASGCAWPTPTTNAMRLFDRLLEAAGIDRVDAQGRKLDIHATRHTAGTRYARAGVPLIKTQRLLGHSDPKLTAQVYTHLDAEDLREAVESIAPAKKNTAGSHVA